ncbi:MAG: Na+/H+ antiporter subunit E [Archaeoglobaceae archaeon]|nr:Na+/H+ antiporter subunit E [Archaeoglobaceae archaeon]MCX8152766.1 Na+/H+ antiporter subunit E [Archaeoglobaceae archaeon]MDW8013473.1 Na+/H+ antiporter subunit E [Archaeoglobaceae archaeon]
MKGCEIVRKVVTFLLMFAFWLVLSAWNVYILGYYELSRLVSGIVIALIVTFVMHEFLISGKFRRTVAFRYLVYMFWLLYQMFLSAIDVSLRVLGFRDLNPQVIEFSTPLRSDAAITTLANSITLTPGTVTIDVDENGKFLVHAIASEPASSLAEERTMIRKVSYVFMEGEQ